MYILETQNGTRTLKGPTTLTKKYLACFDTLNGVQNPIPDQTLALVRDAYAEDIITASRQIGFTEKKEPCVDPQVGAGLFYTRARMQDLNIVGQQVGSSHENSPWVLTFSHCRVPWIVPSYEVIDCPEGGTARYKYWTSERKDPSDPFSKIKIFSDEKGNKIETPIKTLDWVVGKCAKTHAQEVALSPTSTKQFLETLKIACARQYPGFSGGAFEKTRVLTEKKYALNFSSKEINQKSYIKWCHYRKEEIQK